MKSTGETTPRDGWCQRTSASKPVTRNSRRSTSGW
jgi:hypothetical protein